MRCKHLLTFQTLTSRHTYGLYITIAEGFFGWKWKKVYLKVFRNSEVAWFTERGQSKAIGKVILKVAYPMLYSDTVCSILLLATIATC